MAASENDERVHATHETHGPNCNALREGNHTRFSSDSDRSIVLVAV